MTVKATAAATLPGCRGMDDLTSPSFEGFRAEESRRPGTYFLRQLGGGAGSLQVDAGRMQQCAGGGDPDRQHLENVIQLVPQLGVDFYRVVVDVPQQRRQPKRFLVNPSDDFLRGVDRRSRMIRLHPV